MTLPEAEGPASSDETVIRRTPDGRLDLRGVSGETGVRAGPSKMKDCPMSRFTSNSSRRPTRRLVAVLALATTAAVPSLAVIGGQVPASITASVKMH